MNIHRQNRFIKVLDTTIKLILDDDLGPVEADPETIVDEDPEESDHEEETIQTADDIVSSSLASRASRAVRGV